MEAAMERHEVLAQLSEDEIQGLCERGMDDLRQEVAGGDWDSAEKIAKRLVEYIEAAPRS